MVVGGRLKRAKMAAFHKVATERDPPGVAAAETAASYTVATECDEVKLKDRLFIRGTFSLNYAIMCHG